VPAAGGSICDCLLGELIVDESVVLGLVVLGVVVLGLVVVLGGLALFRPCPVVLGLVVFGGAVVSFGFAVPGVCVGPAPPPLDWAYTIPIAAANPRVAAIAPFLILLMFDLLLQ
jgi:hypothetical protein